MLTDNYICWLSKRSDAERKVGKKNINKSSMVDFKEKLILVFKISSF